MTKKGKVVYGRGYQLLRRVQTDTELWALNKDHLEEVRRKAELWRSGGEDVVGSVIDRALLNGRLHEVQAESKNLDPRASTLIVWAALNDAALERLENLEDGRDLRSDPNSVARVRIINSGVSISRSYGLPPTYPNLHIVRRIGKTGEVFEGRIEHFRTVPEIGGRLRLEQWFGNVTLSGLIDPMDNRHRIELEILHKA